MFIRFRLPHRTGRGSLKGFHGLLFFSQLFAYMQVLYPQIRNFVNCFFFVGRGAPAYSPGSGEKWNRVMNMLLSYLRTLLLYLVLVAVVRLMGKRQVGQMEPSEFVVTMLVANLASIPMQETGIPLHSGLVPILTVLGAELVLSAASVRWVKFRRLLCGKPVILIENGKILRENLRSTRITLDELTELLRQKDILQPDKVQFAILETNGSLSVFPYPKHQPADAMTVGITPKKQYLPYTIIADGYLYSENLTLSGRDEKWLKQTLAHYRCRRQDVLLLTVDGGGTVCFQRKEARP